MGVVNVHIRGPYTDIQTPASGRSRRCECFRQGGQPGPGIKSHWRREPNSLLYTVSARVVGSCADRGCTEIDGAARAFGRTDVVAGVRYLSWVFARVAPMPHTCVRDMAFRGGTIDMTSTSPRAGYPATLFWLRPGASTPRKWALSRSGSR